MAFSSILDPVFVPLLSLGYFWAIVILSFIITLLSTLIYKWTTNQSLMKDLKDELKALQGEIKLLKDKPDQAMVVQKKMMETNSKYMMHSFKPMLFTFLPIILIFGWMTTHVGYYPIMPGEEFSITLQFDEGAIGSVELLSVPGLTSVNGYNQTIAADKATFALRGDAGTYSILFNVPGGQVSQPVLITEKEEYLTPTTKLKKFGVKSITTDLEPVMLLNLGFHRFGWLGTYIIFSIIMSIGLRKLLKVY